jgi:hypothetical protein
MNEYDKEWNYTLENQHLSGNPKVFGKDIDIIRRMAFEAMFSTGITIDFYRCVSEVEDFYQDPNCRWDDAIQISAIFEDNPRIKVLKDLGWFSEDEEIRPPIIYLPIYKDWITKEVFDIKDNSLIRIHYFGQSSPSEFRIMEKKMDSVYGVYWVCKLAPERLDNFYMVTQDGAHYLKRSETRSDKCEHEKNDTKEDERVFNHGDYEKYVENKSDDYSSLVMRR